MARVNVYGASDDLIEVDGDIYEEFNALENEGTTGVLAFSDGTVLRVRYDDDGLWRVTRLANGSASYEKSEAIDPDGDEHSDHVYLDGDIQWVVYGSQFVRANVSAR